MALITCPECGREVSDKAPACPHCGVPLTTAVTTPAEAPVSAPRTEDRSEVEKILTLARQARSNNDNENAARYYEMVFMKEPENWEANFYQVYYKAMECKIMNIASAATSVANCVNNAVTLLDQSDLSADEKLKAISQLTVDATSITSMFASAANNHYVNHSGVDGVFSQCVNHIVSAHQILVNVEAAYVKYFPDQTQLLTSFRELFMTYMTTYYRYFNNTYADNLRARLTSEIQKQKPSYVAPEPQKSGCYVATCVYGSYNCPQVWTLRRFRDDTLASTWYGRAFIRCYYAVSPTLVRLFGETKWFRALWKKPLDHMVSSLQRKGVEDTPYNDRIW